MDLLCNHDHMYILVHAELQHKLHEIRKTLDKDRYIVQKHMLSFRDIQHL